MMPFIMFHINNFIVKRIGDDFIFFINSLIQVFADYFNK